MKKIYLIAVVALSIVFGLVFVFFQNRMGKPVKVAFDKKGTIGVAGPIRLDFNQSMNKNSVEERVRIEPQIEIRFSWTEDVLLVWPQHPFEIGEYKLVLGAGADNQKGGKSIEKSIEWTFSVRQPELVFLYPTDGTSDLWKSDLEGGSIQQLTRTDGKVYDYSVSKDGERIVFSVFNSENGKDLWWIDREGTFSEKLVSCGSDQCFEPTISPDGKTVAYSKSSEQDNESGVYSNVWLVDTDQKKSTPLVDDPTINGARAVWSPTGERLAFLDEKNGFVRIFDFNQREITNLRSTGMETGAWSSDGTKMLILTEYLVGVQSFSGLSLVDFEKEIVEPLFTQSENREDFFGPKYSPWDDEIVVGRREQLLNGRASNQIWWIDLASNKMEPITTDPNYSHGSFNWSPEGEQVAYQRYPLGSSEAIPEILVWEQSIGTAKLIIENGSIPHWLP